MMHDGIKLVFIDGNFVASESTLDCLPSEVDVQINQPGLLSILTLSIAANYELTQPIHLQYRHTKNQIQSAAQNTISVAANSKMTLIEEHVGEHAEHYAMKMQTRIDAAANAKIHYYKIQNQHASATHAAVTLIQQQQDSQVNAFFLAKGSATARDDLRVNLIERGAECRLAGLCALYSEQQVVDHYIHVDHAASHTSSDMLFKGLIDKKSRAVFNGKVYVHPDTQQVTAQQASHNLLLSNTAEVDARPELEIYADDLKCAHGATIGQLDEEALFYLRSRGVSEADAKALLLNAFAEEVLSTIENPMIKRFMQEQAGQYEAA